MRYIIVKHLSGTKTNQIDKFAVDDQFKELTLGRGTDQTICYDPDKDDLVSRQHARISREEGRDDRFLITDQKSYNGTYRNKQRVSGTASIVPGDVIQLGPAGPEFEFDLQPRPENTIPPTREATLVRETRESFASPGLADSVPIRTSVGRATVERMLSLYQQSARKNLMNTVAALVGVMVIVAGVLVYLNLTTKQDMNKNLVSLTEKITIAQNQVQVSQKTSPIDPTMNAAQIHEKFGPAIVYIEVIWKLIHTKSDKQIYHHYQFYEGKAGKGYFPAYLQVGERIRPWLSLDPGDKNQAIGLSIGGSGFVVADNGYIMTNRHVAATWHTSYDLPSQPSMLFNVDLKTGQVDTKKPNIITGEKVGSILWVPANETYLVERRGKEYYVVPNNRFEGRFDKLDVTFPKNKLRIPARLVRKSDQHDVALIKIDMPNSVPTVSMYDSYHESRPGNVITVLGYPAVSPDVLFRTKSQDPMNRTSQTVIVPDLSNNGGSIGKIIRGARDEAIPKGGDSSYEYYSEMGDVFQLSLNTTGHGNSGGPVFDDRGRVIGIFTYGNTTVTFAVPIRFGLDIMEIKAVLN